MKTTVSIATALALMLTVTALGQGTGRNTIIDSVHNLSVRGRGAVRAAGEQQVCIFCHATHAASPVRASWNRQMPVTAYTIYSSNSLDALPGQPTGSSKLCLSCHDGTIALGRIVSRAQPIIMAGGITSLRHGASNLGTDLSDDHPISFRYDTQLIQRDPKLKDPSQLPKAVRLDDNRELQCTSCHDAHDDSRSAFLVMDNQNSQLCSTCHQPGATQVVGHQQCQSCHQMHTAPSGPYLLTESTVRQSCLSCHDGSTAGAADIASDMNRASVHDTDSPVNLPDPIPDNVGCTDCHEPHTMDPGTAAAPGVHPNFGQISGVTVSGTSVASANFEYEVCFKCHADQSSLQPWINRQIVQTNTRLEFNSSAISFHPVAAPGKNTDVPSLKPGLTTASRIHCTDCHGSDSGLGGTAGAHGSNRHPLLVARYEISDNTRESAGAYALCYSCHERTSILNDESFKKHEEHVKGENTTCSVCHDAHGISSAQGMTMRNSHLINFDTTVVLPSSSNGRLEFVDQGFRRGNCSLLCHGQDHDEESYEP